MKKSGDFRSSDQLRKVALAAGLPRLEAGVYGVLAYWEQIEGGVVRDGVEWRWRRYAELAAELGYSEKSVGRAVASLRDKGLIATRRMFNPARPGETVNGFRVLAAPIKMTDGIVAISTIPSGKAAPLGKDISSPPADASSSIPSGQGAPSINKETTKEHIQENSQHHPQVDEEDAEEGMSVWFAEYLGKAGDDAEPASRAEALWLGYHRAVRAITGKLVGNYNPKRAQWMLNFLGHSSDEGFSRLETVSVLTFGIREWGDIRSIVAQNCNKSGSEFGEFPDPFAVGVFGHILIEEYLKPPEAEEEFFLSTPWG